MVSFQSRALSYHSVAPNHTTALDHADTPWEQVNHRQHECKFEVVTM